MNKVFTQIAFLIFAAMAFVIIFAAAANFF